MKVVAALALLAACGRAATPLELPAGAAGGSIVLLIGDEAFALDVEADTRLETMFPADTDPAQLLVYRDRLAALDIDTGPDHAIVRATRPPDRPLPRPAARYIRADGWVAREDESALARVRLPAFDVEGCLAGGGCFDRARPAICVAPCPALPTVTPPQAPLPPAEPAAPRLSPCPAGTTGPDCARAGVAVCAAGFVRGWGDEACRPIACPGALAGDVHVAQGGTGDGSAGSPLGRIDDALRAVPPGGTIALAAGSYAGPTSTLGDVTLRGACASSVRIAGPLVLGAGARVQHASVQDGISIMQGAIEVDLDHVLVSARSDAIFAAPGAVVTGTDVFMTSTNGPGLRADHAKIALQDWGVLSAATGVLADTSTLTLVRGAVDHTGMGLVFSGGGSAAISQLAGDRPTGRMSSVSLEVQHGARVRAEDLVLGGAIQVGGDLEISGARSLGLGADGGRIRGRDLRLIDGVMFIERGSDVVLEDVLRARVSGAPLGDVVKDGSRLSIARAVLVDAEQTIEGTASAEYVDLDLSAPMLRSGGFIVGGTLALTRARAHDINRAVYSNGRSTITDLIVERSDEGVTTGPDGSLILVRARMSEIQKNAMEGWGALDISDLDVTNASLFGAEAEDYDALTFYGPVVMRRVRVGGTTHVNALGVYPSPPEADALGPSVIEDLDVTSGKSGGATFGRMKGVTLSRMRARGGADHSMYLGDTTRAVLADLDLEMPRTAAHVVRVQGRTALVVERFRWVGAAVGGQIIAGTELDLAEGRIEGQTRAAVDLEPDLLLWEVLHHVVVRD